MKYIFVISLSLSLYSCESAEEKADKAAARADSIIKNFKVQTDSSIYNRIDRAEKKLEHLKKGN